MSTFTDTELAKDKNKITGITSTPHGVTDGEIIKHSGSNFNYSTSSVDTHDFAGKQIPFSPEYSFYSDLSYLLSDNVTATIGVNQVGDIQITIYARHLGFWKKQLCMRV